MPAASSEMPKLTSKEAITRGVETARKKASHPSPDAFRKAAAFLKASGLGWEAFFRAVSTPRVIASFEVSFGISLLAAGINVLFGAIVAWVLVRYRFPGKKALDSL